MIIRFASGLGEAMEIADEQCDAAKDTTVQMVKVGSKMVRMVVMWTKNRIKSKSSKIAKGCS